MQSPTPSDPQDPVIRCQNASRRGTGRTAGLIDLSLDVVSGEILGITGISGGGKSLLAGVLAGQIKPTSGSVSITGISLAKNRPPVQSVVNYLPQQFDVPLMLSPLDLLTLTGALRGMPQREARTTAEDLLERARLRDVQYLPLRSLPPAQRQLTRCCTAFMGYPHVLVLDSPTQGFDLPQRAWFWQLIQQVHADTSMTMVIVTHDLIDLERVANRVAFIRSGQIIALGSQHTLQEQFGTGPRMELRLAPNARLTMDMRQRLRALGRLAEIEETKFILYPKPDAIGALSRSIPMPSSPSPAIPVPKPAATPAPARARGRKRGQKAAAAPEPAPQQDPFSRSDLMADSWLLDSQPLPGSLGRTVEHIFGIIGRQNIVEFWFAPPSLEDVYQRLEGGHLND
jgi:ABC-2 type transport system ATP-binding protein